MSEARINPVEVDQIVDNGWYSAQNLIDQNFNNDVSMQGNPFELVCSSKEDGGVYPGNPPTGLAPCRAIGSSSANEPVGSMELKAAWMVLPPEESLNRSSIDQNYYTTSRTLRVNFVNEHGEVEKDKLFTVPVALIGFHIVHKTSAQGWIWATFEHINNAPYQSQVRPWKSMESPGNRISLLHS